MTAECSEIPKKIDRFEIIKSISSGLFLLCISFVIMNYASQYAGRVASVSVDDLLWDYLPVIDVTVIHVHMAMLFWVFVSLFLCLKPKYLPFFTKTAALFILVRSGFICLTHLSVPPNKLVIPQTVVSFFLYEQDLFFSGHVGGPFLFALIFWQRLALRILGMAASVFFAFTVLLGHIHYSIDVFAAPFITFGIYEISKKLFHRDYQLFISLHSTSREHNK